jgi:four helix bundle protein
VLGGNGGFVSLLVESPSTEKTAMATIKRFEELHAWQRSRTLANDIYSITRTGGASRDFALRDQLRRAALSVMLNIAEGFARTTDPDFFRFLSYAHGSVAEIQAALYLSLDQQYIDADQFDRIYKLATETSVLIKAFQRYLLKPGPVTN